MIRKEVQPEPGKSSRRRAAARAQLSGATRPSWRSCWQTCGSIRAALRPRSDLACSHVEATDARNANALSIGSHFKHRCTHAYGCDDTSGKIRRRSRTERVTVKHRSRIRAWGRTCCGCGTLKPGSRCRTSCCCRTSVRIGNFFPLRTASRQACWL